MSPTDAALSEAVEVTKNRFDLWAHFVNEVKAEAMAEVGVYRGDFVSHILSKCDSIERYYMVDPWRHLDDWDKPANKADDVFESYLDEVKKKTNFATDKCVFLRGKTTEVVEQIEDGSLDCCYIDADHTLRGITIDLMRLYPKIRDGGWIIGDDFTPSIWQHHSKFEPTMVFPFAVYFAEAMDERIYALPHSQFLIEKNKHTPFSFTDMTGKYGNTGVGHQLKPGRLLNQQFQERFPNMARAPRRLLWYVTRFRNAMIGRK